jgi:beta-galactosidase GanA
MHLNTVLAPAYWELIEPREGQFDFSSVDSLLAGARRHDLRVVLLWFGSWKNSMSAYAPEWVKTNQARFPRTESTRGQGQEILSPFVAANAEADAKAYAALMRHLRRVDGTRHTVIMVQVENEIGMIPTARDHSALADSLYVAPVPAELLAALARRGAALGPELRAKWARAGRRTSGTWAQVFGADVHTEELFMAWHFARFTERVAAAGRREYALPTFVNAALIRPNYLPGRYVSAGPLPHLVDVWRAGAPSIDLLTPDIYFPNFSEWVGRYRRAGETLFVPEAMLTPQAGANALFAIGAHDAIGFSPFSIESATGASETAIARTYALLEGLAPLILAHQGRGTIAGVMPPVAFDGTVDETPQTVSPGGRWTLTVSFAPAPRPAPTTAAGAGQPGGVPTFGNGVAPAAPPLAFPAAGIIIALGPDEFLVAGSGLTVTFAPNGPGAPTAGILSIDEGRYVAGRWIPGRRMNGDQSHQGRHLRIFPDEMTVQRVRLYRYQ